MAGCSDDLRADWFRTDIREVLDNVGMMVSAVSVPDYRHVYLNKELLDAMRRAGIGDCDSLIGKRPWDVFPGWKEAFLSTYEEVRISCRPLVVPDRKYLDRYWSLRLVPMIDHDSGDVTSIVVFGTNVTDHVKSKEDLRASEGRLRSVLDSIVGAHFVLDSDWRFVEVNAVAERELFSRTADELIGRKITDLFPETSGTEFHRQFIKAREEGHPVHFEARSAITGRWYEAHGYPRDGYLELYGKDITGRKETEEALRESEDRLRLAAESGEIGTWDLDCTTRRFTWSNRSKDMFGLPPDAEISYELFLSLVHPEDREQIDGAVDRALEPGSTNEFCTEYRVVRPDGVTRWVDARGRSYFGYVRGEYRALRLIGIMTDVTDRKHAEESLKEHLYQLQSALTPSQPTTIPDYSLAVTYVPITGSGIGGDFYDIFSTENDHVGILIGDVSGKGIPAASLGATARSTLHAFAYYGDTPSAGQVLTYSNSVLAQQQVRWEQFATAFLIILNPGTGHITYSSAGHPPAAICRADGRIHWLSFGYPPIAVDSSFEFCDAEDCLEPGDKIVLYTDGVTEARHGAEMFGPERLEEVLAEHGSRSPGDLLDSIISAVTDWGDGQLGDDTAVIIVERM